MASGAELTARRGPGWAGLMLNEWPGPGRGQRRTGRLGGQVRSAQPHDKQGRAQAAGQRPRASQNR